MRNNGLYLRSFVMKYLIAQSNASETEITSRTTLIELIAPASNNTCDDVEGCASS
jgi:hypothetical protein